MIDGGRHEYWEGNSKFCMRKERMWWNGFSGRVLEVRVHKVRERCFKWVGRG